MKNQINKIKLFLLFILKFLTFSVLGLVSSKKKFSGKKVLLVITGGIGDYILIRNFFAIIKEHLPKGWTITLLGNILWKGLSEELDKDVISEFIWVTPKFSIKRLQEELNLFWKINRAYEWAINPQYSHDAAYADMYVFQSKASNRVGWKGDAKIAPYFHIFLSSLFYNNLLKTKKSFEFEFFRNRHFFQKMLGEKITLKAPYLDKKNYLNLR